MSHTHTHITQVLMREPALISLADSGQLTGKVMRQKLMVMVLVTKWLSKCTAEMVTCFTSQAAGCTLKLWNTHKDLLRGNFAQLVDEVRAQQRRETENEGRSGEQRAEGWWTPRQPQCPQRRNPRLSPGMHRLNVKRPAH